MKYKRYLAFLATIVLAFCVMGLAACGGGGAASSGSAEPQVSDEELIKTSIEDTLGAYVTKEYLVQELRANEEIAELEKLGFNVEGYAENMANIMKFEVAEVKVDGDTAVAKMDITVPNFGSTTQELIEKKAQEMAQDVDVASMSQDEQIAFAMEVTSAVLADPDFPRATSTIDIDYVKSGDAWQMKDQKDVEKKFEEVANATAGLE